MNTAQRKRARRRLDERLAGLKPVDQFAPPPVGWVRAIRDALGMTGVQLAARMKVTPQSIDAMERSERLGSVRLDTLRRAAGAMDCVLVYALVPAGSLEGMVEERARRIAARDLRRVAHTMRLEAQETADALGKERVDEYIQSINDRDLWKET